MTKPKLFSEAFLGERAVLEGLAQGHELPRGERIQVELGQKLETAVRDDALNTGACHRHDLILPCFSSVRFRSRLHF